MFCPAIIERKQSFKKLDTHQVRQKFIEHNLRFVVYIARKFDNTSVGAEDLTSLANRFN